MAPTTPQRREKHSDLTRDDRIRVQTLRSIGWTYEAIANELNCTQRQVQHACSTVQVTPKKRSGRKSTLSEAQIDEIVEFVTHSRTHRLMSYIQLASGPFAHWSVGEYIIRSALRTRGFKRWIARAKPPLSEKNRRERLQWAREHVSWTLDQWKQILWTDETWVTGGRHKRQWVTRRSGEELDLTCVVDKIRRRRGWMFWGSFNGVEKGPCLFWEKEWGTINQQTYCDRIVPLIHGWIELHPGLQLMQDGAPGHSAGNTLQELAERGIVPIFWPAYSPDLNPIAAVWNWMKDWIEENYGDVQLSYDRLRNAVQEAWNAVPTIYLQELLETMQKRCQDVIDAGGGHTKW